MALPTKDTLMELLYLSQFLTYLSKTYFWFDEKISPLHPQIITKKKLHSNNLAFSPNTKSSKISSTHWSLSYKTFFADIVVIYDVIITLKNSASNTIVINAVFGWKTLIIKFYNIGFTLGRFCRKS